MSLLNVATALEYLQMNNDASLVIVTAVLYDYSLTFSREVDYVWRRPWTWVSTIFVVVRYLSLCWAILNTLNGSTYIHGPKKVSTEIVLLANWIYPIFIAAADFVMILRVYAMWSCSKTIICLLLLVYVPQTIISIISVGIYFNPNTYLSVKVIQVVDLSLCSYWNSSNAAPMILSFELLRFVLGTVTLVLAVIPTLKQSFAMYKATRQWQPNRFMQLLAKEGIFYFVAMQLINIITLIEGIAPSTAYSVVMLFVSSLAGIAICVMIPRFIICMRELYDRDLRGHWQGMDTGFGALSRPVASLFATVSAIEFADIVPGQDDTVGDEDESEGIRLEERSRVGLV